MSEQKRGTIDISLLEELRTDKDGNQQYQKIQLVMKQSKMGKRKSLSKWLVPAVTLGVFIVLILGRMQEQEQPMMSTEELVQMVNDAEKLGETPLADLFEP